MALILWYTAVMDENPYESPKTVRELPNKEPKPEESRWFCFFAVVILAVGLLGVVFGVGMLLTGEELERLRRAHFTAACLCLTFGSIFVGQALCGLRRYYKHHKNRT